MKNVVFASSEVVPFIKTGGLADVVGSLPKYFSKEEYDVRVILPKYLCMKPGFAERMQHVADCEVQLGWRNQPAGIYSLVEDGVTFYFIENDYYFAGPKPYGEIYQDAEKFAFFSKAVLTILPVIGFQPDIIHCHDWQTGLIPVYLDSHYRKEEFYHHIRTVFTIHNLKFQGRWYIDAIRDAAGLSSDYFTMDKLESYGQANLLKGGLVYADYITTVSETYAQEIQSVDGGEGLDGLLRYKANRLAGIVNGLDYEVLNPATDTLIASQYQGDVAAYKKANKADLQATLGLDVREDVFLIGMVSRLTDQKGFDLVDYMMDEILGDDRIQIAVLGTGEEKYENMFRHFSGKYPGRVSANIYYSEEIAQKIYASCDAFLMPSLFEPCGLSQLMSLRYGTVPMVRETGGLKDTVEAYNEFEHTGTGFSFHNYNAHEMLYMVRSACKVFFQDPEEWKGIVERGMNMDFSWKVSCARYAQLYELIIAEEAIRTQEEIRQKEEEEARLQKQKEEEMLLRMRLEAQLKAEEETRLAEEAKKAEEEAKAKTAKKAPAKKAAAKKTPAKKTTAKKSTTKSTAKATTKKTTKKESVDTEVKES